MLVLHTSGYGKYLGRLNVVFDSNGEVSSFSGNPLVLDHSRKEDPALKRVVAHYRAEIDKKMSVVVGDSLEYIDGGRPGCRLRECAYGDLATDAMAAEMGVGMAVLNSGSIKGSFNAGEYAGNFAPEVAAESKWGRSPGAFSTPASRKSCFSSFFPMCSLYSVSLSLKPTFVFQAPLRWEM